MANVLLAPICSAGLQPEMGTAMIPLLTTLGMALPTGYSMTPLFTKPEIEFVCALAVLTLKYPELVKELVPVLLIGEVIMSVAQARFVNVPWLLIPTSVPPVLVPILTLPALTKVA